MDKSCNAYKLKQVARILQFSCNNYTNMDGQIGHDFQNFETGNLAEIGLFMIVLIFVFLLVSLITVIYTACTQRKLPNGYKTLVWLYTLAKSMNKSTSEFPYSIIENEFRERKWKI